MTKAKKSASPQTSDNLNPLLTSVMDAVVRHTDLDQMAVEKLRRALASIA
jgi:hypothetical protein